MGINCCLCSKDLMDSGYSPLPLGDGWCCNACNYLSVIPAMIEEAHHSAGYGEVIREIRASEESS
tara:strand:+ start:2454 stop:2648 length:195 start_codon:yes stop_codon:yes gene_type:complete